MNIRFVEIFDDLTEMAESQTDSLFRHLAGVGVEKTITNFECLKAPTKIYEASLASKTKSVKTFCGAINLSRGLS